MPRRLGIAGYKIFQYGGPYYPEPAQSVEDLVRIVRANRQFAQVDSLQYGDHGLDAIIKHRVRCNTRAKTHCALRRL